MDLKRFLTEFENYFILYKKIFNDNRTFVLKPYLSKGHFSKFVPINDRFTFTCYYDQKRIEIYYKSEIITESFYKNHEFNEESLEQIARYLATHEYEHTFFCDSTYTLKILFGQKILLNNHFNFLFLTTLFNEFTAELHAKRIHQSLPKSYLDVSLDEIKHLINEFFLNILNTHQQPSNKDFETYDYFQYWFNILVRIYTYDNWDEVIPIFDFKYLNIRSYFTPLRIFCQNLYNTFKQLYKYTIREVEIRNYLTKLAELLSNIRLWDLVRGYVRNEDLERIHIDSLL